ncbi:hypothetical protein ASG90_02520 [Nocardioides sp. Soil797]|nr:hypothetical protein ASG90_02520 [Nocardioides sp. Soil797]
MVVSTNLGKTEAPTAQRASTSGWRDPRLWIGVALVAASILIGVKVIGGADDTIEVWAVRSDLAKGQQVESGDLVSRRVRLDDETDLYLHADQSLPDGAVLARGVGAGELLPRAAVGGDEPEMERVPLTLAPELVPANIRRGQRVNVWIVAPSEGGAKPKKTVPVLEDVVVLDAPKPDESWSFSGARKVDIGVPPEDSGRLGDVMQGLRDDSILITGT